MHPSQFRFRLEQMAGQCSTSSRIETAAVSLTSGALFGAPLLILRHSLCCSLVCTEHLIDLNATQAAIRAGYSERTARKIGHENLTKPDIAAAIEEAQTARSQRTEITADRVLQELARIGFADVRDLFTWDEERTRLEARGK